MAEKSQKVKSFDLLEPKTEESTPLPVIEPSLPEIPSTPVNNKVILVYNKSNHLVELDFGRGKEIRIEAKSTIELDATLTESKEFRRATNFLTVRN